MTDKERENKIIEKVLLYATEAAIAVQAGGPWEDDKKRVKVLNHYLRFTPRKERKE
jgi:hypothetical protein